MKRILVWRFAAMLMLAGVLSACADTQFPGERADSSSTAEEESVYDTTTVAVGTASQSRALDAVGNFADVTRVAVTVSGEDKYGTFQSPLTTAELTVGQEGTWEATLDELPIGPSLTFMLRAYDSEDRELFSGSTTRVLEGGDTVTVSLAPVSSGESVQFPIISSITLPQEVTVSSTVSVTLSLKGSPNEVLSYEVTTDNGSFSPAANAVALPESGVAEVVLSYTAPSAGGQYSHTVAVTNSLGNSVESAFTTKVVYELASAEMVPRFAPVVEHIAARRNGSLVSWTATVSDDGSVQNVAYQWAYQPAGDDASGALFVVDTLNPGVMGSYNETAHGTISLTVTDSTSLGTTISFALQSGQFPDNLVVNPQ